METRTVEQSKEMIQKLISSNNSGEIPALNKEETVFLYRSAQILYDAEKILSLQYLGTEDGISTYSFYDTTFRVKLSSLR